MIDSNTERLEDFFAGIVAQTKTIKDAEDVILNATGRSSNKTYFPYVIVDNKSKQLIGFIDVKSIDWNIQITELDFFY